MTLASTANPSPLTRPIAIAAQRRARRCGEACGCATAPRLEVASRSTSTSSSRSPRRPCTSAGSSIGSSACHADGVAASCSRWHALSLSALQGCPVRVPVHQHPALTLCDIRWRIRQRLEERGGLDCRLFGLDDGIGPKPPRIHWKTYRRLEARDEALAGRWRIGMGVRSSGRSASLPDERGEGPLAKLAIWTAGGSQYA